MSEMSFWKSKPAVAVLGGSLCYSEPQIVAGFIIGQVLARQGCVVVTGATNGIPYAAALGAHSAGGLVIGISPAASPADHLQSGRPQSQADAMIYTGMGADGRSPLILRSVSGAIFIGGEFGTLGEFCSGWLSGCPVLGVLEDHGGLASSIRSLVERVSSSWGSVTVYDSDPAQLALEVSARAAVRHESEPEAAGLGADVREILQRGHLRHG